MKLLQKIRSVGRKALITTLVLTSLTFGIKELNAQETQKPKSNPTRTIQTLDDFVQKEKAIPKRKLTLDFVNPLKDFEARTYVWHTSNLLFGKGNDYLGIKLGFDKNVFGRLGLCALAAYSSGAIGYYLHEISHDQPFERRGIHKGIKLDFSDWFKIYPRYVQKPVDYSILSEEETFRSIVNGLNQDEFNARINWEQGSLESDLNLCDSISYLLAKLDDFQYTLTVGFKEKRPDETGLETLDLIRYYKLNDLWDDVNLYTGLLYNERIDLSKKEHFAQSFFADALTFRTWESFGSIWKYIFKNERTGKPLTLRLTEDIEITPPLCSLYRTLKGSFCDMSVFVNPNKDNPIKLSLGTGLDFIGDGEVDHLRVGGEYYNLKLEKILRASPFAYLNFNKSFDYKGISLGTKVYLQLTSAIELRGKIEYNKNDIIENIIKGEDKGVNFVLGLNTKF